jgi:fermentation-respiration switch protein FrsA (DUF1100 family)
VKRPAPRSALRAVGRFALSAGLVLTCAYLLVVMAACTFQRSLLYFPDPADRAPDPSGPPVQVIRLETQDHEHLVAWFLPPAAGQPVILHFGGNGDSLIGDTDRLRLMSMAGVGGLFVAYRGYSGSSGRPSESGLHLDAEAAYAWLSARYPPSRIVIYGHSLGSGVAVWLAVRRPARALVLESPFTSAIDVADAHYGFLPVRLLMWDRFDSAAAIGKVRMPLLIVHGDQDDLIPIGMGRRLFDLANPPKAFVAIAGAGHNDLPERGVYDQVWRFLHVGVSAAGP